MASQQALLPRYKLHINLGYLEVLVKLGQLQQPDLHDPTADRPQSWNLHDHAVATLDGDIATIPLEQDTTQTRHDPNRFGFFSSALECTIHASQFGNLVLPDEDISSLFNFHNEDNNADGVWWLNVNNPSPAEVRVICMAFGIHPLTMEDIDTKETREKIELFPSYYFASFRLSKVLQQPDRIKYTPFNVYLVVFREGTISFSFAPNNHASEVRSRIAMMKEHRSTSNDWICYAIIDDIVDTFAPEIARIERETAAIKEQMYITRPSDHQAFLWQISRARKDVLSLLRLLDGKADVLGASYTPTTSKSTKTAPSHYLTRLSIDGIEQGNQTNALLSRLNVIATVLFGMNFRVPGQDQGDDLYAFWAIMAGVALSAIAGLLPAARWRKLL
ncbi:hypothetical protein C8A00DRAFT_47361 [Chaetomidium leptoderma]|uniref:Uncharacterized protein n=1 Tax=Chaetomidium leptoderma TaxID=669021 RepID=A0AAN6VD85_9PEZI|nr:hypothetical protein C8A00DRAFT_47361 [Chaetomidium leptoderma]